MFAKDAIAYEALPLPDRSDLTDADRLGVAKAHYEHMRKRHSVRDFTDQPVERAVIETCIRTAGTAPSGANHQPGPFVAIAQPEAKHRATRPRSVPRRPRRPRKSNSTMAAAARNG